MRAAVLALALLIGTPAAADEIPSAMRGTWARTAADCAAYRKAPEAMPPGAIWVSIGERRIVGSTSGWLTEQTGPRSFNASGSGVPNTDNRFELRADDVLAETIGDARAAELYRRCVP